MRPVDPPTRPAKCKRHVLVLLVAVAAVRVETAEPPAAPDLARLPVAASDPVDFTRHIRPLIEAHCQKCHGAGKQEAGLRLDQKAAALKGGDSGKVILPGRSQDSRLIHLVAGLDAKLTMPAKGPRLTSQQIGLLRAWIDQGAIWPDEPVAKLIRSQHWSLQPLRRPVPPTLRHAQGGPLQNATATAANPAAGLRSEPSIRNSIDQFVLARLAEAKLSPAPEADRATLLRRLSFDLIGLPPTPQEIDTFVSDTNPRAYEAQVDRLLASPRYGERWGRHWLDVARYTESQGFEYDKLRDQAWHYRDYVINSLNQDKPYNRFMQEQVAGDVLPPVTSEGIVGASLLVCGPWDEAGNSQANATQKAITREEELEDLLSVVGQTFLGLTINCARCHSHKFDPIPQEEYYRLKSVFDGVKHGERAIAAPAEIQARDERNAALKKKSAAIEEEIARLEAIGWGVAAGTNKPAPSAFARWTFEGATNAVHAIMPGKLHGGATISEGRLHLSKPGAFYQTAPLPRDIREKTLEVWVALDDLKQGGGAAISLESEDGSVFDAIVYGERQPGKWMAGSSNFQRTRDLDAPEETTPNGRLVHMAIVYQPDNRIALFRNGAPYGQAYATEPLPTYRAGQARVVLGRRHLGGGRPFLTGAIKQAALYDRALSPTEVAAAFRTGSLNISKEAILAGLAPEQRQELEQARARLKQLQAQIEELKALPVSYAGVRVQPPPTRRLKRGDVTSPEEIVTPGALSAIVDLEPDFALAADAPEAQRRLKFAQWLADPRNPLPARVMANRVWHFHFGQGLVATPNDFGVSGAQPTHPELLDWLAFAFIESGWSIKALHRLIVTSATYRQSSRHDATAAQRDADNLLLWRFPPRRLEGEVLRDTMLALSGQLNLTPGGPSFRPFDALKFPVNAYVPADKIGPEFNRRSVYRMNVNSGKEPLMDAFDCPDPSVKTPRRGVTTTPLQALGLMNNSFVLRQADHLAERVLRENRDHMGEAVRAAYRYALGRPPSPDETQRALAASRDRGLSHVCWALLNSTEFVYVK